MFIDFLKKSKGYGNAIAYVYLSTYLIVYLVYLSTYLLGENPLTHVTVVGTDPS